MGSNGSGNGGSGRGSGDRQDPSAQVKVLGQDPSAHVKVLGQDPSAHDILHTLMVEHKLSDKTHQPKSRCSDKIHQPMSWSMLRDDLTWKGATEGRRVPPAPPPGGLPPSCKSHMSASAPGRKFFPGGYPPAGNLLLELGGPPLLGECCPTDLRLYLPPLCLSQLPKVSIHSPPPPPREGRSRMKM